MDFCRNVTVSGEYHQKEQVLAAPPPCSKLGATLTTAHSLEDLFPAQNTEVDVSLEWLSVFVEDCLSSTGNCHPVPYQNVQNTNAIPKPLKAFQGKPEQNPLVKLVVPGKARSKRKRVINTNARNPLSSWSYTHQTLNLASSDPPLLQQTYWLADSELIMPQKDDSTTLTSNKGRGSEVKVERKVDVEEDQQKVTVNSKKDSLGMLETSRGQQQQQQARRCTHCLSQRTPQWRAGPLGPKTLCNACGVRYKSGRLLPEYRPAKSPTFVSYLHSNSHKRVLEMRNGMASSAASHSQ